MPRVRRAKQRALQAIANSKREESKKPNGKNVDNNEDHQEVDSTFEWNALEGEHGNKVGKTLSTKRQAETNNGKAQKKILKIFRNGVNEKSQPNDLERGFLSKSHPHESSLPSLLSEPSCSNNDNNDDDNKNNICWGSSTSDTTLSSAIRTRLEHQKRRKKREVHSNGPMLLSRRTSYKMSVGSESSPLFSPIAASKLSFTPEAQLPTTPITAHAIQRYSYKK